MGVVLRGWGKIGQNKARTFSATTKEDYELKFGLLDDTLTVLDPENYFKGQLYEQIGGFDLIYKGGQKIEPPTYAIYKTYLGCHNNRREQLKLLARAMSARQTAEPVLGTGGKEKSRAREGGELGRGSGGGGQARRKNSLK